MYSVIIIVALTGQTRWDRSGSLYTTRNSARATNPQGYNYYRYKSSTREVNPGRQTIYGLNNIYSNGVRREIRGNHIYDYGTHNRNGITRPFGSGTRTYYSNGQVDTLRGNYFRQERYNPNFPFYENRKSNRR